MTSSSLTVFCHQGLYYVHFSSSQTPQPNSQQVGDKSEVSLPNSLMPSRKGKVCSSKTVHTHTHSNTLSAVKQMHFRKKMMSEELDAGQ